MSDQPELGTPIPIATISNVTGEIHAPTAPLISAEIPQTRHPIETLDELSRLIVLPISMWAAGVSAWLRIVQAQSRFPSR
ncbi:hypothetical protein DEM27_23950 [Metarhizobium album]|uniref:Uncharacterized protein n=1 Tax=Metarhizobium album TaxID=2182425 RepID=A0A2U2DKZ9_9HYPH|nr:hypothetical protein [Rhizobium album]PWE53963.1 hypothetical protein DEM27_23950 [Rhizobium album]